MDFKGLLIFKTVYDVKSLNKAAKILGYSQSNLTAHLKKMEHELRATLFIRSFDGMKPTAQGHQFYAFSNSTLEKFAQIKLSFKSVKPLLLISELLFQFIVIEKTAYQIESTDIVIKKTCEIENEINQHNYDKVITFKKFKHKDYDLTETGYLPVAFLKNSEVTTHLHLPVLINNDADCPLRAKTLAIYPQLTNIITIDSLSQLLNLVEKGQAIALLPVFFAQDKLTPLDTHQYPIDYFCYQHQSV